MKRPGDNPFERNVAQLVNQRTTHLEPISITSGMAENYLAGRLQPERNAMERQQSGVSLNSLNPASNGGPLPENRLFDLFRTPATRPDYNDGLETFDTMTNVTHAVNRVAKPLHSTYDAIGKYELGMLYGDNIHNSGNALYLATQQRWMQANAQEILNPAAWNWSNYLWQLAMYNDEATRDEYLALTPDDVFTGWSFDGVVEFEVMRSGRESTFSSGFTGINDPPISQCKNLTMASKGMQYVYNYFGDNVRAGADLYAIIKKFKVPTDYTLTGKHNDAAMTATKATGVAHYDPFKPYQVAFLSVPYGGQIDDRHLQYIDEEGYMRYDTKVIRLGQVFSAPIDHRYKESEIDLQPFIQTHTSPPSSLKPFTDARVGTGHQDTYLLLRIIMDTHNGVGL